MARSMRPLAKRSPAILLLLIGSADFARAAENNAPRLTASAASPVPPSEAPGRMKLPDGFRVTLFAAEPDVRQPIAFTFDDRGRLWVVECYSYPQWKPEGRDRILIFEDADGDGRPESRKVFFDHGANFSGIEYGFGGVYITAIPNLLHIPDKDGDDVPDGPPVALLDGWNAKAGHNVVSNLAWGPDGWLYGLNGIQSNSFVGRPGAPAADRVALNCGVWRYHPVLKTFEAFAHGTTNPWGLDFDQFGQLFITNCVIPHLWHVVPGAHFQRMYGQDMNPHAYGLMESCADHIHWAGGAWQDSRGGKGKHGEAGGGHAHAGAMIYLGDNWPLEYRGSLFTCNIHGNRVNRDRLERSGSGYVARHAEDFLHAGDEWFRGLMLKSGPDGSVFLIDWSDSGECHESDAHGAHRESGRIYRIAYGGGAKGAARDIAKLPDEELGELQRNDNVWLGSHSRRLLQERAAEGRNLASVRDSLKDTVLLDVNYELNQLRSLWSLLASGGVKEADLLSALELKSEHVRGWAVRLLVEGKNPSRDVLRKLSALAWADPSPRVRLELASALQRVPLGKRRAIAEDLASHSEDAADPNVPLMIWYGIEPLVGADPEAALAILKRAEIPILRRFIVRRRAGLPGASLEPFLTLMADRDNPGLHEEVLAGLLDALRGRRSTSPPPIWPHLAAHLARSQNEIVRERSRLLALSLGDPEAVAELEKVLFSPSEPAERRLKALEALVERRVASLGPRLIGLLDDPTLRSPVLRSLAAYSEEKTPEAILGRFGVLSSAERRDAVATLSARSEWALALLGAVETKAIATIEISASAVRQLKALGDPKVDALLERVWGTIRPPSEEKAPQMKRLKSLLTSERLKEADLFRGRALADRNCLNCHRLFDAGGDVGPDLTGSQRSNIDYLLENILDPSAVVGRDWQLQAVFTKDGRLIAGIIRERTESALVLQTANEKITLATADIARQVPSEASMMPEGGLENLTDDEVRDLIAYIMGTSQVPLPAAGGGRTESGKRTDGNHRGH